MNIILSRKGFDSTLGGGGHPNWIYKDTFYPVPIPENNSGIKYENLKFNENKSYLDVMLDLNVRQYTECHLDPNLGYKNLEGLDFWEKSLGQAGNSNQSLKKCNVDTDSIFLFFGWFEKIKFVGNKFEYAKIKKDYPTGMHAIYGYLEVDERLDDDKVFGFDRMQPHVKFHNKRYNKGSNSIYKAKDQCSFNSEIKGAGLFKFDEKLILTERNKTRSNWILPQEVMQSINKDTTYLYQMINKQNSIENKIRFNTQGQEIIFKDANQKIIEWARILIKNNHT